MKNAFHAISLFEEFKKSNELHEAFRRLVWISKSWHIETFNYPQFLITEKIVPFRQFSWSKFR